MTASEQGTIYLENASVLQHESLPGDQYRLRLKAPSIAASANPGTFAHIRCDESLPMRRPMSIMRVDPQLGWVEFLYRKVGTGTHLLSRKGQGEGVSLLGPIGNPFTVSEGVKRPLLVGGGVGVPPIIFLAERLCGRPGLLSPLVLAGSERPFPFTVQPSRIPTPGIPAEVVASVPLLDDWGVSSRLASLQSIVGCFHGYVTDLARVWLSSLHPRQRAEVAIYACGPVPMLRTVTLLAREYDIPCQVSLEEYMACAVGGCAGCTVAINTEAGPAMKRVCVDGPVFDGHRVIWS
jgi:dihydroorotate dehydrogenase electron transfer subunit